MEARPSRRQQDRWPRRVIESYIALGDGLSLDPLLANTPAAQGPGSLLASELARNYTCARYKNYARERSRMNSIWRNVMSSITPSRGTTVVTISTGLEDLIDTGLELQTSGQVNTVVQDLISAYRRLVRALQRTLPNATIVGTTVPDPTGGIGRFDNGRPFPSFGAILFNDLLKEYANNEAEGFHVADVFERLLNPDAWTSPSNVQLSTYGCQVIATTWLGEIAKSGLITLKAVA
jgi:hypothetical protein